MALQADAARTLRRVDVRAMSATRDACGDSRKTSITKKLPVERYCERFNEPTRGPRVTDEWLTECSLVQFTGEIDWAQGGHMVRRAKPRIVKLKPFLNLDMASHQAPRMARMALRLFRPFGTLEEDPWTIDDDEEALRALEEFIKDVACPAWLVSRYEQHNRVATRKRKASERKDECGDKQATEATEAQEDEADDETEQGVIRRQSEANAPQLNNARTLKVDLFSALSPNPPDLEPAAPMGDLRLAPPIVRSSIGGRSHEPQHTNRT